ncbi:MULTISPECIES: maleylpyruvate isomerase family mycothiol-dependent enzyme [unclassified Streptomyces]|uniref:maleylpyruvate isomerase family mycothiol-dependent enzyme n=1 Tax=unclassified Streptomyces TaxID=2593676 RepID=UPI002E2BB5B0|nr:maleylpyruvate isomerase family mycothiol-dependent enzyme [Streptomyces sp. NBC_00223]
MTLQRPDPVTDTTAVAEATERLLDAVAALPEPALAEPSLLPGWTRGHVLAHLARNADGLRNLLTWARTGTETPMYDSAEARDQEIERDAGRPLAEHLDDLRASARRLAEATAEVPPAAWAAQVALRTGRVIAAAEIPYRRLVEVLLHHVDLDIGYGCADLPAGFAARELALLADGLTGHEGIAAVRLEDTGDGSRWTIGAAAEPDLAVSGSTSALLTWVSGRGSGDDLAVAPEGPLPVLPPLG